MIKLSVVMLGYLLVSLASAHDGHLDPITVIGHPDWDLPMTRIEKESITRTEVISREKIQKKNAQTLADAVDRETGIDTQISCGTCGTRRVTVNGLRSEHTTIVVDGIPLHSAVSSFYGMDAIPVIGIEQVEVLRGPGMSLGAPEAIGGVLNIRTKSPWSRENSLSFRAGNRGFRNYSGLASWVSKSDKHGLLVGAQWNEASFWDQDNNGVAEAPANENKGYLLKYEFKPSAKWQFNIRHSQQNLNLIGGNTTGLRVKTIVNQLANHTDFDGGDVRNQFIGDPAKVSDFIDINRQEYATSLVHHLNSNINIKLSSALALQSQDAIYNHGYDYSNKDSLNFNDLRMNMFLGSEHFVTVGTDFRIHKMRSDSLKLYDIDGLEKDSFNHHTMGFYLQDEWFIKDNLELSSSIRFDKVSVNWIDRSDANKEVDETIIAPRFQLKHKHHEHLDSRLHYGIGYRAPLTLFESQHGSAHDGFEVRIDSLEKASGLGYGLDYHPHPFLMSWTAHFTRMKNLAFGVEGEDALGEDRLLFINAPFAVNVWSTDLTLGFEVNNEWFASWSYEYFHLEDRFKQTLPVAAIEQRSQVRVEYHTDQFLFQVSATFIKSRDLKAYGYDSHFNIYDGINVSAPKKQRAPSFYTIDLVSSYQWSRNLQVQAGITNLLNFTQVSKGDSPLTWDFHNDHVHLDNFHIWGPLIGRQFYAGLEYQF